MPDKAIDINVIVSVQNGNQKKKKKKNANKNKNGKKNDSITTKVTLDLFTSDIGMHEWFDRYFEVEPVTYLFDASDVKNVQVNETELLKQILTHHTFDDDPEILSFILHEVRANLESAFENNVPYKQVKEIVKQAIKYGE